MKKISIRESHLLVFILMAILISCKPESKPFSQLSALPKTLFHSRYTNLLDTTSTLQLNTNVHLTFDSLFIKFEAEIQEKNIKFKYKHADRDSAIWKDPCIEIFLDPGADGKDYYELQVNAFPQVWDLKLSDANGPINDAENILSWDIGNGFECKILGTPNDASDKDDRWLLVGYIPWSSISEGRPKPGDVWGYNIMRVDYDSDNNPSYWVAKPTGKEMIHYPLSWPKISF